MRTRQTCAFRTAARRAARVVAVVLAGLAALSAQRAQAKTYRDGNGLTWYYREVSDDSAIIVNDGDNSMFSSAIDPAAAVGEITVPERIYDLRVVGIGENAFTNCTGITACLIPEAVRTIGKRAFYACSSLTNVAIPDNVAEIGSLAFYYCSRLQDMTMPASVKTVGSWAFNMCTSLTNVTFEARSEALTLETAAFRGCPALKRVTIGGGSASVSLGEGAFRVCTSLEQVTIGGGSGALTIGTEAFKGCSSLARVEIEGGSGVLSIGTNAFNGCSSLAQVEIEGGSASWSIGTEAFKGCSSLARVTVDSLQGPLLVGDSAFANCPGLLAVDWLADGELKSIGENAFYGCTGLAADLVFPSTVTNIGQNAFFNCTGLTSVRFAEPANSASGSLTIRKGAFLGCSSVTNLYLSRNVAEIGEAAFQAMAALSDVRLPPNLTALADSLFVDCTSLAQIDLPTDVLETIGSQTFYYSTNLHAFTIPASVGSVGSGAFRSTGFWLDWPDDSPLVVKDGWLLGVKGSCPGDVVLTNVQHVADGAFANAQTLTNLVISETVRTVGANAFKGCTNLVSVGIDAGVQLDDTAFYDSNWLPTGAGEGVFVDPTLVPTNFYLAFDANGGAGNMATQTFRVGIAKAISSNQFTRALYEFDGWANSPSGSVAYVDGQVVSNLTEQADGTIRLYAHWRALTDLYTVSFNANGGSGTMSGQTFAVGQGQELNANQFARSSFAFQGWGLSATGEVAYADGQFVEGLSSATGTVVSLYAIWDIADGVVIRTAEADGCVWHYVVTADNTATIVNIAGGQFVGAVEAPGTVSLVVPEELEGVAVTAIGERAFAGCPGMASVVLPATVVSVGANAFAGCTNLSSVTMPVPVPLFEMMPECYGRITRVVVPSNTTDFLESDVSVCDYAFSNCTSLVSVSLPLGMAELPVGVFADCTALVDFEMPYTVKTIAERAFFGCTGLTALTVTENVAEIGADVFSGCRNLKVVRYLGDEPESVDSGIYRQANRALVSGYLRGLRSWPSAGATETTETGGTNETSTAMATVTWPSGDDGRPLVAWNTTRYAFKKITLDYNGGGSAAATNLTTSLFYVTGRVLGDLPEPDDPEGTFIGWFTARYGGEEVDPYTPVTSAMTFYAHWEDASGAGPRGIVDALEPLYDGDNDAGFAFSAATFDGVLVRDGAVAGTIRIKTRAGKYSSAAGGTNSAFTATVQALGAKKASLKGIVEADGTASVEDEKKGLALELEFTQFGVAGTYETEDGSYEILGARDRYSAGSDEAQVLVRAALANARGTWNVVLPVESADGDGAALAQGYAGLTVTIGAKGKARIVGTMPDGARVAVSSTLLVGNGCCCLPVVVPLYAGKTGGFAFALWFTWEDDGSESQMAVAGLSEWDATGNKAAPFAATFGEPVVGAVSADALTDTKTFGMEDFFEDIGADDAFSPDGTEIEVSGTRWKVPRADGVRFSKDEGWYVPDGRDYGNPAGLKLTFSAKTGTFKGSFKVFAVTDEERSKRYTATVTGVVVGGVGYGTATIRKVGSVPARVE